MTADRVPGTTTASRCPLCGCTGRLLYEALEDRLFSAPGVWDLRQCDRCITAWLDPQPDPEDIHLLYTDYYTHVDDAQDPRGLRRFVRDAVLAAEFDYRELARNRGQRVAGAVLRHITPFADRVGGRIMWLPGHHRGCLLDVGCGSGAFLDHMHSFGWTVRGIEPDPVAAAKAQERGLEVDVGTLESVELAGRFDAITLGHVLEHLSDPEAALSRCAHLLKRNGVLVMTTPNLCAYGHAIFREHWRGLEVPRHLMLYSAHSLRLLLTRCGFAVRALRTTSRIACAIWGTSGWLRSHPTERLGKAIIVRRRGRSFLFRIMEDVVANRRMAGEELLAVATRN